MPSTQGVQKKALDPLELQLQMVISYLWFLGIEPRSSGIIVSALLPAETTPRLCVFKVFFELLIRKALFLASCKTKEKSHLMMMK